MKKKIFTLFTALTLSAGALFASNTSVGGIYYNFYDANLTATVTYRGSSYYENEYTGDVVIPATVTYDGKTYSVKSIGDWAFASCSDLTSVTIPNSVTSIGMYAFYGCSGLTEVTIPNSITRIGDYAFYGCSSLTSVVWNAKKCEDFHYYGQPFLSSQITSFTFGNEVEHIPAYLCDGMSNLTSVTIPNSVTSIGEGAFDDVPNIVYNGTAIGSPWGARSVNGYIEEYLVYKSEAKTQLLACYSTATGEITIPSSVTSIGESAFSGCSSLTSVTIPNSITRIGDYAFRGCSSLTSVVWNAQNCADFPSSSQAPFYNIASQITSFTFGNEVEHIPAYLCYDMENLTAITIPNSVTNVGKETFYGCSGLTSVVWDAKNCADFSSSPFNYSLVSSSITSFTFGNEVEHIPAYLCYGMENLTLVTIPNSVTSIGEYAFAECSGLTKTNYTGDIAGWCGINFVGWYSNPTGYSNNLYINDMKVKDLVIPNSVTNIGNWAFEGCSDLTSVTIPNSITSIGWFAFKGCSNLTSVVWDAKNCADFSSSPFNYSLVSSSITSFTFGNEVEHIPAYLCYGMENLTLVTIPNSVTSIGEYAFAECSGLTKTNYTGDIAGWCGINFVGWYSNPTAYSHNLYINDVVVKDLVIPNSVRSIGGWAFGYCSGLTSVTIPNSVTSIGEYAFAECSGLTSVTIPNSVTSIGEDAFYNCSSLTSVVWNAKNCADFAEYYDEYYNYHGPFYNIASKITSFTFGSEVEHIPAYLCYGMENLTSVTIPNSVKTIAKKTFTDCTKLKTVVIGNAVTNIGDSAFYGCDRLLYLTSYAEEPPFVGTDPFSTYNVYLKVPCSSLDAYKMYAVWRDFNNISCIGSETVDVTEFSVTPSTNEAQFTWPAEPNAATYELVISKDGVVFCTLTFNASGQLMGIAFAPGAGTAATTATSGFQFTVTGLDEASHYTYTFDAKDAGGSVVKHYAGEFNTDGFVGLGQIELAGLYTQAGRIVCEGEFRIYDLLGRDVTRLNGSLSGVYVVKTANAAVKVVVR